eukprot:3837837-Pyramimonas_sp.AAC.1
MGARERRRGSPPGSGKHRSERRVLKLPRRGPERGRRSRGEESGGALENVVLPTEGEAPSGRQRAGR